MQLPINIRRTKKCQRCNLRYPRKNIECAHCFNLSDHEVEKLKLRYKEERKGNANIGWLFIFFAVLILLGLAISY